MRTPILLSWPAAAAVAAAAGNGGPVEFLDETFAYDEAVPAAGRWVGNVQPGRAPDTWGYVDLEVDDSGDWSGRVTLLSMQVLALNATCADIAVDGDDVAFSLPATPGTPRFEGTVGDGGQRLRGTITWSDEAPPGSFELARFPETTDLPRPLAFAGALESPFGKLPMTFVFAETPGGHWIGHADVPAQGLLGFPLRNVRREGDAITAELGVIPVPAGVEAEIVDEGRRLAGVFRQGTFELEVDFARDDGYVSPTLARPQHPKPPFPYVTHEVTIEHPDGHHLAGTLTLPPEEGPHPAAVMITGSGPQDRDETVFGHKPFLVIADYLTRRGIAVLRYDDRGTGGSTGDFSQATSEDLATDAAAAVRHLAGVDEVDPRRIGLIGHSEGGTIAPMTAGLCDRVAFMVLLAGTGVPGEDVLRVQGEKLLRAAGATEARIAALRQQQETAFRLLRQGASEEAVKEQLRAVIQAQLAASSGMEGEALEQMVDLQMKQLTSGWMRYFLEYDPRPALRGVDCPVLALNGTLDLQVWHEQNLPEIEKAVRAGGGDVTVRRYEGLNHLFQPAETGSIMEYATNEVTFDEAVLRDIVEWIEAKTES